MRALASAAAPYGLLCTAQDLRYAITPPRFSRFLRYLNAESCSSCGTHPQSFATSGHDHCECASTRPRRERTVESKCRTDGRALRARSYSTRAASQMVSRAENRPLGIFSALFAYFLIFIRTKRVSPDFEPALVGHSWARTDFARYLPTRRAPGASLIGFERTGVA